MAKKRAQIDATLTVASLSEVFTQDIEDMTEFIQQEKLETMTPTDAANMKVTFGKYKGKTLREIYKQEKTYITWLADNARDITLRQAAQTVLEGLKEHKVKQTEKAQQVPEQHKQEVQQKQTELSSEMEQEELNLEELDGIEISDEDVPF